jgi:hypothetical protein
MPKAKELQNPQIGTARPSRIHLKAEFVSEADVEKQINIVFLEHDATAQARPGRLDLFLTNLVPAFLAGSHLACQILKLPPLLGIKRKSNPVPQENL